MFVLQSLMKTAIMTRLVLNVPETLKLQLSYKTLAAAIARCFAPFRFCLDSLY